MYYSSRLALDEDLFDITNHNHRLLTVDNRDRWALSERPRTDVFGS
jgi:hypothetical protein